MLAVNLVIGCGYSVLERVRAFATASSKPVPYRVVARRPVGIVRCYAGPALTRMILGWRARHGLDAMCADDWRWQC